MSDLKKNAMLQALESSLGVVTTAARAAGIERSTHYRWMREDDEYAEQVHSLKNITLDFVESQLFKKIKDGDTTSMIFYLKTQGKKRGYIERVEQEHIQTEPSKLILYVDETDNSTNTNDRD